MGWGQHSLSPHQTLRPVPGSRRWPGKWRQGGVLSHPPSLVGVGGSRDGVKAGLGQFGVGNTMGTTPLSPHPVPHHCPLSLWVTGGWGQGGPLENGMGTTPPGDNPKKGPWLLPALSLQVAPQKRIPGCSWRDTATTALQVTPQKRIPGCSRLHPAHPGGRSYSRPCPSGSVPVITASRGSSGGCASQISPSRVFLAAVAAREGPGPSARRKSRVPPPLSGSSG